MTRTSYRPLVALGLIAGLLAYVGCSSRTVDSDKAAPGGGARPSGEAAVTPTGQPSSDGSKLVANWPTPAGAIIISGEQFGYLEPCGCTQGQLGGLKRRYDLIERLRDQQKWPLVLIDLGSLIKDPAGARGGFEQAKLKFHVALKALGLMKYNALALSAEDLKVGTDEALMQFTNILGERTKVLAANVVPAKGFETMVGSSLKTAAGPIRLGITAVIDPEAVKRLADPAKDALLAEIKAPDAVLPGVLDDLEKDTQVQVLMVQGPPELARTLGQKYPGFDVVVGTSHVDPPQEAEPLNDGKTMLVTIGHKGQYVGVVGIFQDPKERLRYQRVTLNTRYNGPAQPMRDLIEDEFQGMLKAAGVVENFPRHDYVGGAPGARFVGVETCRSCHPNTVAKWATTKHAHAFDDIVKDPKGERSDHQFDAECVSCHTTGFEYTSGWMSAALTPELKGNQCENCHGPASKHVEKPDDAAIRKTIALTAAEADHNRLCIRCHDGDNSPKFDFTTYWGQIAHKKLDSYDDPKVREGLPAKVAQKPGP
jgi:hypothetical protein